MDQSASPGERTRQEYLSLWRNHVGPFLGSIELAEFSTGTIRSWRAALLREGRSEDRVAKAYRLVRGIFNTAADDGRIKRNPCRIKGAGEHRSAERTTATVPQVYALAERMPDRFRVLVVAAAFTGLRWGELIALRRCDVDLTQRVLYVGVAWPSSVKVACRPVHPNRRPACGLSPCRLC